MKRQGTIALTALALALAGCGGDDDGGDSEASAAQEEDARNLVIEAIAAYQDEDYEGVCELSSEEINTAIPKATGADTCAEGYVELFRRQGELDQGRPFDDFVDTLGETEVGDATLTDTGATVDLEAPGGPAQSFLIEESGELKVQELFFSENAPAAQAGGSTVSPGG